RKSGTRRRFSGRAAPAEPRFAGKPGAGRVVRCLLYRSGMNPWNLKEEHIHIGLSAMKNVALVNGDFADAERQLITAAARALGTTVDPDALPVATPEDVASVFTEPVHRERLVQALIVMA